MNDTERLNAMIENGWSISGPTREHPDAGGRLLYTVFAGEVDDVASAEDPRMAIDFAIAHAQVKPLCPDCDGRGGKEYYDEGEDANLYDMSCERCQGAGTIPTEIPGEFVCGACRGTFALGPTDEARKEREQRSDPVMCDGCYKGTSMHMRFSKFLKS